MHASGWSPSAPQTIRRPGALSVTVYFMPLDPGSGRPETAVFLLGPLDGQEQPIAGDTDELSVVMSDGQQHRYVRTDELCRLPGGRSGVVFEWTGRYYGPK